MKEFRLLNVDEIDVKVKMTTDKGSALLLYKTARTDMDLLDETVGPENWDCDYKEIKGNLYCDIGIRFVEGERERWVHKSDCGIESREDSEGNQKKGEASDAFKRAGFKWGIGRELYTAPFIWITRPAGKYEKFYVSHIAYTDRKISELLIVNDKGELVYDMSRKINLVPDVNPDAGKKASPKPAPKPAPKKKKTDDPLAVICSKCGAEIKDYTYMGQSISAVRHEKLSVNEFGECLCIDCIKKIRNGQG